MDCFSIPSCLVTSDYMYIPSKLRPTLCSLLFGNSLNLYVNHTLMLKLWPACSSVNPLDSVSLLVIFKIANIQHRVHLTPCSPIPNISLLTALDNHHSHLTNNAQASNLPNEEKRCLFFWKETHAECNTCILVTNAPSFHL